MLIILNLFFYASVVIFLLIPILNGTSAALDALNKQIESCKAKVTRCRGESRPQ